MIPQVIARLKARVTDLGQRVEGAADLSNLMRQGSFPQATPVVHVLPSGLTGEKAITQGGGMFFQAVQRQITLILTIRTHDATGARAMETVDDLLAAIIAAIAGYAPLPDAGVFKLIRCRLDRFEAGTAVYEIVFSLPDELRIPAS